MSTTLMLNPKRRKARKSRKAPSAKQRANWARFAKMARSRAGRSSPKRKGRRAARRSNPITVRRTYSVRRSHSRRRRNPISLRGTTGGLLNLRSYIAPLKEAAIMGAGAVAMDMAYGYATPYLPAMLQRVPGRVGLGDLAKAVLTIAFGKVLSRPTRGLSMKAAMGALVVQGRDIALTLLPRPPAAAVGAVPSAGLPFQGSAGLRRNWSGTGMNSGIGAVVRTDRTPMVLGPSQARFGGGGLSAFTTGSPQLIARR